jgi:hypothetical protein
MRIIHYCITLTLALGMEQSTFSLDDLFWSFESNIYTEKAIGL